MPRQVLNPDNRILFACSTCGFMYVAANSAIFCEQAHAGLVSALRQPRGGRVKAEKVFDVDFDE